MLPYTYRHTGRGGGDACVLIATLAEAVGSPPSAESSRGELVWSSCAGSMWRKVSEKKRAMLGVRLVAELGMAGCHGEGGMEGLNPGGGRGDWGEMVAK